MVKLMNIPVSAIMTNSWNPRKHFSNIEELAQNISEVSLIQPIAVRAVGEMYRLICGERRLRAVKSLGWTEIPANVFESDGDNDNWWMLSENLQREDLTDSEKGDALQGVRNYSAISNREMARKIGVDEKLVRLWLQAAGYPEEVKEMTKAGVVTDKAVSPIAQLSTPQEQIKAAEYIRDNDLGYKEAKATVDIIKDLPPPIRSKLTDEPEYTVSHAVAECVVETEDEYYNGTVDYKTTKDSVMNCKNILKAVNCKVLNVTERTILRGELGLLKVQLENIIGKL